MTRPTIIFVHGMNANAESWNGLEAHPSIATEWPDRRTVTLAGHDEPAFTPGREPEPDPYGMWCPLFGLALAQPSTANVTMDDYVASVIDAFPEPPPAGSPSRDVILVGHSMGGVVISQVAVHPAYSARIRQLVYVAAMLPAKGDSIESLHSQIVIDSGASFDPFGVCTDFKPHLPDCASALVKQPKGPLDAVFEPTPAFEQIEAVYIGCSDDKIIPPPAQTKMLSRAQTPPMVVEFDASHLPQYLKHDEFAAYLAALMKKDVI